MRSDARPVLFPSGGLQLEGLISGPGEKAAKARAVFCHPHPLYGGDMNNNVVSAACAGFEAAGVQTLRFNFRGVGQSRGLSAGGAPEIDDVVAAVDYFAGKDSAIPLILGGYSFGAWTALEAAKRIGRLSALVLVSLPIALFPIDDQALAGAPALLACGDRDDFCPTGRLRDLGKLATSATITVVPRVDHFWFDAESKIAKLIEDFCNKTLAKEKT